MPDPGDEFFPYLIEAGCDPGVIAHCRVVCNVAVGIADKIILLGSARVDRSLVAAGAILHDIGRSESHGMDHADAGGKICREIGLDDAICRIVECHIGAGLTGRERKEFGLSDDDRIPETLEEKIVAHADNLVKGIRIISRAELERAIGKFPVDVRRRFIVLADELEHLSGTQLP